MPKGLKHTEETKRIIGANAEGKGKGGFNVKVNCPHCNQQMSPANLAKHEEVCKNSRGIILNGKELTVKEQKHLRRVLRACNTTVEEYIRLYNEQEGKCAICGNLPPGSKSRLSADHCHKTGKSRGLLCDRCNLAIGLFDDDTDLITRAIDYLKAYDPYKD